MNRSEVRLVALYAVDAAGAVDRQAVSILLPDARLSSICRSRFNTSSSEYRFLAIPIPPHLRRRSRIMWLSYKGAGHPVREDQIILNA
jgi:hypothetical protein